VKKNALPKIKVGHIRRKPKVILPAPHKPRADTGDEAELLGGMVQNKKASAPEERFAKALDKLPSVDGYEFRYTIGAPRGMPGWKELDYLVSARGMVYAFEVDTEFTHRQKGKADVLHDAIVLKDLEKDGMDVAFQQVFHLMGETDLVDQKWADSTAKRIFA